ncbi:P-loop containing nucleoside triphosphate hydrolase protein [Chytridium lagenaria]|nr:P-loop containing nucleoside triphosphate hydrolase protein [Chytridium lagenaria]
MNFKIPQQQLQFNITPQQMNSAILKHPRFVQEEQDSSRIAFEHIMRWRSHHKDNTPLVVGISGPQGSGKTTLAASLFSLLREAGVSAARMSLDDFYLTRAEQIVLAKANPGNVLLEFRGNPGTHDTALAMSVLEACKKRSGHVAIPVFNKSMHGGLGDRADSKDWMSVNLPVDVVLFEGWCIGFRPPSSSKSLQELVDASPAVSPLRIHPMDHLAQLRTCLESLAESLNLHFNALIHLSPPSLDDLQVWQEDEMRMKFGDANAMTPQQVKDFVDRFLPAYMMGMPMLLKEEEGELSKAEKAWADGRLLKIVIDQKRDVLDARLI